MILKIINFIRSIQKQQPEQSLYLVSYADSERTHFCIQLACTCFAFPSVDYDMKLSIIDLILSNQPYVWKHIHHHANYFHFPNELLLYKLHFFLQCSVGFFFSPLNRFFFHWLRCKLQVISNGIGRSVRSNSNQ